jgi:hypothetical protein
MADIFRVIGQREIPDITPTGAFHRFIEVTFETADGHIGTVRIPEEKYKVDYVREQVAMKAATMTTIANL